MLGTRNGGAAAWGVALIAIGAYGAYTGEISFDAWNESRARRARAEGERLMREGETGARYRAALEAQREKTAKKRSWFGQRGS